MKDDTEGLKLLGGGSLPHISQAPGPELLEAFPNKFLQRPYIIQITFPEYTSLCPVTGQPDFGTICVEYIPDRLCVESKSFKLYMFAYRNHQSFMETITNQILDDLFSVLSPCWCLVKGLFVPRGGTQIHVFAEEYKKMDPERTAQVMPAVARWKKSEQGF